MKHLIIPALATLLLSTPALCACEPEIAFPIPRYNKTSLEPAFAAIQSDLAQIESLNATFYSIEIAYSKDTLFQHHHVENTPTNASSSSPADALIYRAGSQTKLFTALAVLQQAAAGKISLDHSICNYYAGDLLRDDECPTVTVRALLAHVAGIRSNFVDLDLLPSLPDPSVIGLPAVTEVQAAELPKCGAFANYTQPCGEKDLAQALVQSPPVFPSGAEVSYSNMGYDLLGLADK